MLCRIALTESILNQVGVLEKSFFFFCSFCCSWVRLEKKHKCWKNVKTHGNNGLIIFDSVFDILRSQFQKFKSRNVISNRFNRS